MTARKRRGKPSPPSPRPRRPAARAAAFLWAVGVVALAFAAYIPSLGNGFTNWDDNFYVTENPLLAHPDFHAILTTPVAGNFHPLTIWSLVVNYRISGLDADSYHWLSLLLHLGNTALVFLFVWMLSGGRLWTTVVTAGFFGIHPMHVESVAWIAGRKDVLYTFFYLAGLVGYLRYVDRRQPVWLAAVLIAFVFSAASKPAAVVFPFTLLAIDYFRRRPFQASVWAEKAPFFAVSVVTGLFTLKAQQAAGAITEHWGPFEKVLFAGYGTAMYAVKLFLPFNLSALYPYPSVAPGSVGPQFYLAFATVLILLPLIFVLARRVRVVLFGMAFFFINIVLVLQLFTVGGAVMADRYTYLPYVGLFFALSWWLDERTGPRPAGIPVKPLVAGIFLLLLPVSMVQTWNRCGIWRNPETLWNDTIRKHPRRSADAYNNRGFYYYQEAKRFEDAVRDFDEALALNPRFHRAWINKGSALAALGRNDSALVCYERALDLKPDDADAWNDRGTIEYQMGRLADAAADFTRAIALNPRLRGAYANRALAYVRSQEYEKSIADSRRAIELQPDSPDNYLHFGSAAVALSQLGRYVEAIREYDEAIRRAPAGEPLLGGYYLYRSYSRRALGETTKALEDAREAVRLGASVDPGYLRDLGG